MIPVKDNIPSDRFALVTVGLILANAIVYLLAVSHGGSIISGPSSSEEIKYGAFPYALTHAGVRCGLIAAAIACHHGAVPNTISPWKTVFTALFMHASILHLGGNMLFLWIFGRNLEDTIGRLPFLAFYLLGGVAALALQVAIGPSQEVPTLGASGAIAAVLGGYVVLYPRARVLTLVLIILFFTVIELPAVVLLVVWFAMQAAFAASHLTNPVGGGGAAAYFAQLGGFIFGLVTIRLVARRRKPLPPAPPGWWSRSR